jgi:hypothetical protein
VSLLSSSDFHMLLNLSRPFSLLSPPAPFSRTHPHALTHSRTQLRLRAPAHVPAPAARHAHRSGRRVFDGRLRKGLQSAVPPGGARRRRRGHGRVSEGARQAVRTLHCFLVILLSFGIRVLFFWSCCCVSRFCLHLYWNSWCKCVYFVSLHAMVSSSVSFALPCLTVCLCVCVYSHQFSACPSHLCLILVPPNNHTPILSPQLLLQVARHGRVVGLFPRLLSRAGHCA